MGHVYLSNEIDTIPAETMTERDVYAATQQCHRGQCVYCLTHNSLEREEDTVVHEQRFDPYSDEYVIVEKVLYTGRYECKFCHRLQPAKEG